MGLLLNDSSFNGLQLLLILGCPREMGRSLVNSPQPDFPSALEVTAICLVMTTSSEARWDLPGSLQKGLSVDNQDDFGVWGSWI